MSTVKAWPLVQQFCLYLRYISLGFLGKICCVVLLEAGGLILLDRGEKQEEKEPGAVVTRQGSRHT